MKEQNQGMTTYQKKFILATAFAQSSLVIMAISLFGLYYHNRETDWQSYTKRMNEKIKYIENNCAVWMSPEEYKLKKMEWDYNTQGAEGGVGAEIVKEQQK